MNYSKIFSAAMMAILFIACSEEQLITEPGKLVPLTVAEDVNLPSITVNGVVLHAEAFGHPDSTIVVCIHGGLGSDYRYMLHCKELAEHGYRVVFYDQRGSGLSARLSRRSYTDKGIEAVDAMRDELLGVIQHYKTTPTQKVYLIGHSWGAMLATYFAGHYPNEVQGLVVAEPGGLKWPDVMDYVEESLSFKLWGELLNDASYFDQFVTGKENQHEILDYKLAMLSSRNEITGDDYTQPGSYWRGGAVINAAMYEIGTDYEPDFSEGISQFEAPVLFLYSAENKAYPDAWAQRISSAYHTVNRVKVPGTGHDGIISNAAAWTTTTLPAILSYFNTIQ